MSQEQLLRNYIKEQSSSSFVENLLQSDNVHLHGNQMFGSEENSTNPQLDDFKNKVKIWMKLDSEIKEISSKIKMLDVERKQRKKYLSTLTPYILSYMSSNEIEKVNTKEYGRLQYKTSLVKPPLSQKDLKSILYNKFSGNHEELDKIFKEREKVTKVSLQRLLN